jgi:alpha-mannosidase
MPEKQGDGPFHDCRLAPDAILGTHTFEDVLFTEETSAHSQATVKEAKEFAASINTETPQIALPVSVEAQIETQSALHGGRVLPFQGDRLARTPPRLQVGRVRSRLRG